MFTMGPLILFNMAGVAVYGTTVMGKAFLFTCTLPSLFFFWFVSQDKKGRFFFTFCLADTVSLWIIAVTNLADFYFGGGRYILMFFGRLLLFPLLEWVAVKRLRKPYLELQGFILILVLMPMTYATIFMALYRQLLLFRKQQSERILQEQKNALEAQLDNQQRIRRMKHDMKGHTAMLSGLLSAGKTQEALCYLQGVETEMDSLSGQFCANPYLNAVFVYYFGRLQEMGAEWRTDIQIGEEELPYMELCQILSNGLENACDALKGIGRAERKVSVQMKYSRDCLLIRIRNRCREGLTVEKGTIPSTNKEGYDHGFGLSTIQEAAGRLEGEMFCYTENGNFVLDVMLSCRSFTEKYGVKMTSF